MTTSERSLATILFTDIVGSTERATELGDRKWRQLLEEHHARVRRELRRFGGRELNISGDGFLAVFELDCVREHERAGERALQSGTGPPQCAAKDVSRSRSSGAIARGRPVLGSIMTWTVLPRAISRSLCSS